MLTNLENALFEAILARNEKTACALIELSSTEPRLNLEKYNEEGKSFLACAIELNLVQAANKLFTILECSRTSLFNLDRMNRSLAWFAAYFNDTNILDKFIKIWLENEEHSHLLFFPDVAGNTPLHIAVVRGHLDIVKMILASIQLRSEAVKWINQANLNGDTALHLATKEKHVDIILDLHASGALLDCYNNDNKTIVDHLLEIPQEEQVKIFSRFSDLSKYQYLSIMKKKLYDLEGIDKEKRKEKRIEFFKIYLTWAALHKLESYLSARLEFDKVFSRLAIQNGKRILPDTLVDQMPLYRLRHFSKQKNDFSIETQEFFLDINNDRERLNNLITHMADFVNQLQSRPRTSQFSRTIAYVGPFVFTIFLIGLVAYFSHLAHEHTLHASAKERAGDQDGATKEASKGVNDVLISVISALFGCMVDFFISILWYGKFSMLQVRVMHHEWETAFNEMQEISTKLIEHHDADPNIFESTLMKTNPTYYTNFLVKVGHLADRSIVINKLIEYMSDLILILKTLRSDMNLSNQPLGLFHKKKEYVLLDIEDHDVENNNENDSLLQDTFLQRVKRSN